MNMPNEIKPSEIRIVATAKHGQAIELPVKDGATTESSGSHAVVVAGNKGTALACEKSVAVAGPDGIAECGRESLAYSWSGGTAKCVGPGGIAISRAGGTAQAADYLALTLRGGKSIVEGAGVALAFNDRGSLKAQVQASKGGVLIIAYIDAQHQKRYVVGHVDGTHILSDRPYTLNSQHQLVPA